jgi:PAS domain S-box-containing protein
MKKEILQGQFINEFKLKNFPKAICYNCRIYNISFPKNNLNMKMRPKLYSILVVDDEEIVRESLSSLLRYYGYYVSTAQNGLECLKTLSVHDFDLVILDIVMPYMSGIEVLKEIKKKYSDMEVIMITGFADKDKVVTAFRLNAYDFIEKPYETEEILNTINNCLRQLELKREIEKNRKELRESEERFRQIFEQNEDAIMIFEPKTFRIVDVNPVAENLFGYTREELTGNGLSLFIAQRDFFDIREIVSNVSDDKDFPTGYKTYMKRDGTKIIVTVQGKPVRLKNDTVIYCSFRDITEKVLIEEEARLIQAKLIHFNKMTSLGLLASGIAHEINNPNNFIMFNAPLVSEAWKDGIQILTEYYHEHGDFYIGGLPFSEMKEIIPKLISGITDGSRRIKNIVDNLKDFSRQEKVGINAEVDINKVINAAVLILNNQIKKYTENFVFDYQENLPTIKGNAQQLEQVIINLILNSLQALPGKSCGIWISTAFDRERSGHVTVKVRDEGIGMSMDVIDRVTEPFYTTKLNAGGTGLGLFISYSIINEHQGSLEFKSKTGEGTTAIVKLPAS